MTEASVRLLPDGKRLHLQHGPIDLIIAAAGNCNEVNKAYRRAWHRFQTVLPELVEELDVLRSPAGENKVVPEGTVARNMYREVNKFSRNCFVTPMAAVAGAVADEILHFLLEGRTLRKAYVNNGGDLALWLSPGVKFRGGLVSVPEDFVLNGTFEITHASGIRGIATSGWRGRSHSLGIADSVTVLAANAARADVAATLIANSVDLPGHGKVIRAPAQTLDPDSDLGERLVTTMVQPLSDTDADAALARGAAKAKHLYSQNLIIAVVLRLQDQVRFVGDFGAGGNRIDHSPLDQTNGDVSSCLRASLP